MNKFFSVVLAGFVGGILALGGAYFLSPQITTNHTAQSTSAQFINMNKARSATYESLDFKAAARKAMPAVVHIKAKEVQVANHQQSNPFWEYFGGGYAPRQGSGSGVIYTQDGYIITNNHVVDFADEVEVTLYDNRTFQAKVIGKDKTTDLAVIKIEADDLPTLRNATSDNAEVGDWVLAVGNPFDLTSTVTAGIISAKARSINILGGGKSIESFIQTDAAVNPGNSGGALIDAQGRLLGINSAIASKTGSFSGYSFVIPIEIVTKVVDDLIQYGKPQRGLIGIDILDLDSELAKNLGVSVNQGVVVRGVMDGSAGQFAGVLPDDVITKVDGIQVKSAPELQGLVGRKRPGDVVKLTILRDGKKKEIPVRLKAG